MHIDIYIYIYIYWLCSNVNVAAVGWTRSSSAVCFSFADRFALFCSPLADVCASTFTFHLTPLKNGRTVPLYQHTVNTIR